ncbi:unnamed protein product [Prorocentrum cordatum]|uniref:Guanosine-3',5'-bis(diphosphate) 3'-pyrophosphohydrolase MESH1 n=1 Tax=Prorocentrum cordatum TaxID=2364126 RepID=A0ABN9QGF6_9DINO|nr:unnamed protein product [Polarella glacialis]
MHAATRPGAAGAGHALPRAGRRAPRAVPPARPPAEPEAATEGSGHAFCRLSAAAAGVAVGLAGARAAVGAGPARRRAAQGCCRSARGAGRQRARRRCGAEASPEWTIPEDYNWEANTQENYSSDGFGLGGRFAAIRDLTDVGYHGCYTEERERFQDSLVEQALQSAVGGPRREPLLLFTAGAMGVGKTFVIQWMKERGLLPLEHFVLIDPDRMAKRLPEWSGYWERAPSSAALMTKLEAGLVTELSLVAALQDRRSILVDSSLRHGSWYARVLDKVRKALPEVRIALLYIHSREEMIHSRAASRGLQGRVAIASEVNDSLQKMSRAVGRLLPYVDAFVQIANNGDDPTVLDPAGQPVEGSSDRWPEVRRILSKAVGGEAATPLAEPPRILPTSDTNELWPLLKLLSTMVFAAKKHRRDVRKDPGGTPYIAHPLAVSRILTEVGIRDVSVLQVALLHDTLEDTDTTFAELQANFGVEVARAVESLTDDDSLRPATRKLAQLRGVSALPLKAKLVRIADKLHNVWDILRHGIPGWSERRVESYVAWACELVRALEGTHAALERRFHQEVSLPPSYEPGDWERRALQRVEDSQDFEELELMSSLPRAAPLESDGAEAEELPEHKACSSLLRAAEFMARRSSGGADQIIRRCSTALILAQRGVRDVETLQAALLQGIGFKRPEGSQEVPADCPELAMIRSRFGKR